jgi:hypothetical protein
MDEQSAPNSAADPVASALEASANQATVSPETGTAEDSREAGTKKAEADSEPSNSTVTQDSPHPWQQELKRFHDDVNDVLASKENLKLKTLSIKTRPEFSREWTYESNRYMLLMVNLRRRLRSGSNVDQKMSGAA